MNENSVCLLGNGVVLHVPTLFREIETLKKNDIRYEDRILISDRAHLLFDLHQHADGAMEGALESVGKSIGSLCPLIKFYF